MTLRERMETLAQQLQVRAERIRDKASRQLSSEYNTGRANELDYVIALLEEALKEHEQEGGA